MHYMASSSKIARALRFAGRWAKRIFTWIGWILLAYLAILLIGLVPTNNAFQPTQDGVTIFIVSNAVHADVIVPANNESINWHDEFDDSDFRADRSQTTHVAIGWGDRGFFLETPTWDDLKLSTAANALLIPSESCLHVSLVRPEYFPTKSSVTVSQEQYAQLVAFIKDSFRRDKNGRATVIANQAYTDNDAFYKAKGSYHILNTCNSWVGRALYHADVRVPLWSPMPGTPTLYFPRL